MTIFYSSTSMQKFKNQVELFNYIRITRGGRCEVTGKEIPEPLSYCFPHVLPKWLYPEYKYDPNNIIMVSTMELHRTVDRLRAHHYGEIKERLRAGERITFNYLKNLGWPKPIIL